MSLADLSLVHGIPEQMRDTVVRLFNDAFSAKLRLAIPCEEQRLDLLTRSFLLKPAIGAVGDGKLLGFAGIKTREESMSTGVTYRSLLRDLGFFSGQRAAFMFSLLGRNPAPDELILEFFAVDAESRGVGVGSRLLARVEELAVERGFDRISLEVVDTNPRARQLYERHGYRETKRQNLKWLKGILGFGAVSVMTRGLSPGQ